jgi:integrase
MKYLDKAQDYIKEAEVERTTYNIDELGTLSNTACQLRSRYKNCIDQYRDAYLFSCFSGLRWSDVNQLTWEQISYQVFNGNKEYYIKLKQVKTQREILIPLGENALSILLNRQKQSKNEPESPYVFPLAKETHPKSKRVYHRVRLYIKKWAKESGFDPKKMHFHNSRHTFATNLINYAKPDIKTVSKLLGHKSIRSTEKYAHIRNETQVAAVQAIPKINFKPRPAA